MMTTNSKYIAICTLFILNTGSALATGGVTNTAGPRLIDILDNTQRGLSGDEGSIGYVTYNQVGGHLLIDVHVLQAPNLNVPCRVEAELVTESPNGSSPDWATGGIIEEGLQEEPTTNGGGHFGPITPLGDFSLNPGPIAGVAAFMVSTGAGAIQGAQGVGLRNYGHINLEPSLEPNVEACLLDRNQVGASRVEWITTP